MSKNIKEPKQFLLMICAILFRPFDVLTHDLCYSV